MPRVSGFLHVEEGDGPVDPGFGGGIGAGHPGNALPPGVPPIGGTLPEPPPGIWPPISWVHPIQPLPPNSPTPPGTIWPPPGHVSGQPVPGGGHPSGQPVPGGGRPDNALPGQPNSPGNALPSSKFWIVAGIPGVGWRYVCVDPSLTIDAGLPPSAQPKS